MLQFFILWLSKPPLPPPFKKEGNPHQNALLGEEETLMKLKVRREKGETSKLPSPEFVTFMAKRKGISFFFVIFAGVKGFFMKNLVVLTGAGMSAESGISTFRDSGGLWDTYNVEDVATPEGWARDQKLVTEFYNIRRRELQQVKPCRGHELLASLESQFNVEIITQNVDNLHERAGSTKVCHLHGELMKVCSSRDPNNPRYIETLPPDHLEVKMGDLAKDGSQLRPFIVWFGEAVPNIERAAELSSKADIYLIIGTSLNVYPAAGLIHYVPEDCPIYLIDPKPVQWNSTHRLNHIMKGASEGMEEFIRLIKD